MTTELKEKPHYIGHRMRLKERFLKDNGKSMADYELLELILALAIPRRDTKEKAKELIKHFGSFSQVISASQNKLFSYGLSTNVVVTLKLISTSSTLLAWQNLNEHTASVYKEFDYVVDYCRTAMAHLEVEEFKIIYFDAQLRIVKEETMQRGSIASVAVHPREIVKNAIAYEATSVILVHNHPSGKLKPSENDLIITRQIKDALLNIGVAVNDHIIVTKDGYYSFLQSNILERL